MDITRFIAARREKALLLGDYGLYRQQLSRRLLTLRRKLGHATPKGRKYTARATISSADIGKNNEFLHLILILSERAWAHAMHMRSIHSAAATNSEITGSNRKHIISRFTKAAVNAEYLVTLLRDEAGSGAKSQDLLEAEAYAATLRGAVEFEKRAWEKSLVLYSEAHVIYAVLGKAAKDEVFSDFQTSTTDPLIRYAAYKCQLPRITGIPLIARQYFPKTNNEVVERLKQIDPNCLSQKSGSSDKADKDISTLPKTITWKTRTVDIGDASIATAVASINDAATALIKHLKSASLKQSPRKDRAAAYDDVLIACQDATDSTNHAIEQAKSDGLTESDRRVQDLQVTRTAVNFMLVEWRIGRNRVLDGELAQDEPLTESKSKSKPTKTTKPNTTSKPESVGRKLAKSRERLVLYDATLQSLDSIKGLPGVAADVEFLSELEGKYQYFQSLKCLIIAQSHALLSNQENALTLFAHAFDLSRRSREALKEQSDTDKDSPALTLFITSKDQEQLHHLLAQEVSRYRALVEIEKIKSKLSAGQGFAAPPLVDNIEAYPLAGVDLKNIVTFPPTVEPIPLKPVFLDIAWNYIQYPGQARVAASPAGVAAEEAKQPQKKGWFGFGR